MNKVYKNVHTKDISKWKFLLIKTSSFNKKCSIKMFLKVNSFKKLQWLWGVNNTFLFRLRPPVFRASPSHFESQYFTLFCCPSDFQVSPSYIFKLVFTFFWVSLSIFLTSFFFYHVFESVLLIFLRQSFPYHEVTPSHLFK